MAEHRSQPDLRAELLRYVIVPSALYAMLLVVIATFDFDHRVADHFFDPAVPGFPARHGWWADRVGHDGGRVLVIGSLALALGTWCLSFVTHRAASLRRASAYVLCVFVAVQIVVVTLQHATALPCPRALQRYGGTRPEARLFAHATEAGRCFPGRHAGAGFSFFALYWLAHALRARFAAAALGAALLLGGLFAAAQWARGAHFPSHDLTSAWLAWLVAYLMWAGPFRRLA